MINNTAGGSVSLKHAEHPGVDHDNDHGETLGDSGDPHVDHNDKPIEIPEESNTKSPNKDKALTHIKAAIKDLNAELNAETDPVRKHELTHRREELRGLRERIKERGEIPLGRLGEVESRISRVKGAPYTELRFWDQKERKLVDNPIQC